MKRTLSAALLVGAIAGCDVNRALEGVGDAQRLSADLLVQFTKAADASNRAVMADTDEASVASAREAEQAKERVQTDADALAPILQRLGFADEAGLLATFTRQFAEYREIDRRILDLAVENTNLKAQRLSFGPAQEAADAFRDALASVVPSDAARDTWRVKALAATAIATVREMQVLQAPHVAEADDAVMTRMEQRMAKSEADARAALAALGPLVEPASRARLALAGEALDRFTVLHAEILALSRRNTNVRSVALALDDKEHVAATCGQTLQALRDALRKRGFTGTR